MFLFHFIINLILVNIPEAENFLHIKEPHISNTD